MVTLAGCFSDSWRLNPALLALVAQVSPNLVCVPNSGAVEAAGAGRDGRLTRAGIVRRNVRSHSAGRFPAQPVSSVHVTWLSPWLNTALPGGLIRCAGVLSLAPTDEAVRFHELSRAAVSTAVLDMVSDRRSPVGRRVLCV